MTAYAAKILCGSNQRNTAVHLSVVPRCRTSDFRSCAKSLVVSAQFAPLGVVLALATIVKTSTNVLGIARSGAFVVPKVQAFGTALEWENLDQITLQYQRRSVPFAKTSFGTLLPR